MIPKPPKVSQLTSPLKVSKKPILSSEGSDQNNFTFRENGQERNGGSPNSKNVLLKVTVVTRLQPPGTS